jgi:hypothetical protein
MTVLFGAIPIRRGLIRDLQTGFLRRSSRLLHPSAVLSGKIAVMFPACSRKPSSFCCWAFAGAKLRLAVAALLAGLLLLGLFALEFASLSLAWSR